VVGRDVDPAREAGYLDRLTARFVTTQKRSVKTFVKDLALDKQSMFRRGF
jgi:hypothetical protein